MLRDDKIGRKRTGCAGVKQSGMTHVGIMTDVTSVPVTVTITTSTMTANWLGLAMTALSTIQKARKTNERIIKVHDESHG